MSDVVSSTPQKIVNRKSLNDTKGDTSECLDLSIKEFFIIIYYPDSDPGKEYEILSEKDLGDSWDTLEKGVVVDVKFGTARVQGTVVTISDDLEYLKSNFKVITEEHEVLTLKKKGKSRRQFYSQAIRRPYIERHIIKVADKETQTMVIPDCPEDLKYFLDLDYQELRGKYQSLKRKLDRYKMLFSEIKSDLENTTTKLGDFKQENFRDKGKDGSSPSSWIDFNDLTPVMDDRTRTTRPLREENKENVCFKEMIQIGSNGTKIPQHVYDCINWCSYTAATRKLLVTLFPRSVLATHSLTGKPSPAFLTSDKQTKMRLNPDIISDIVERVSKNCGISESLVRNSITTKCADENKLWRKRNQKIRNNEVENDTGEVKKRKK